VVIGLPSNTIRDSLDVHHPDFLETNAIVYNALRLAAKTGNVNVLDTLFRHVYRWPRDDVQNALDALGAGTYNVDKTALPVRIRERLGLIKRIDQQLGSALVLAAKNGHTRIVEMLIEHGVSCLTHEGQAFRSATSNGHVDVLEVLLANRGTSSVANVVDSCLICASSNGKANIVDLLLTRSLANVHALGDLALRRAVENGHADIVEMLIYRFGVDVHVHDDYVRRKAVISRTLCKTSGTFRVGQHGPRSDRC